MKITIESYNEETNQYIALIHGLSVKFDPFVSGVLNGKEHRVKIDSLIGKTIEVDLFQGYGGTWLLSIKGESQFKKLTSQNNET